MACATILAVDGVLITLSTGGCTRVTVATSEQSAVELDLIELVVDGPSQHAFRTGHTVHVAIADDRESRWPGFVQAVSRSLGQSLISAHPIASGEPIGVLTTIIRDPGDRSRVKIGLSSAVTQLLATILSQPNLTETFLEAPSVYALDTHLVATGMIMTRLRISSEDAFALLRSQAYGRQETLTDTSLGIIKGRLPVG